MWKGFAGEWIRDSNVDKLRSRPIEDVVLGGDTSVKRDWGMGKTVIRSRKEGVL